MKVEFEENSHLDNNLVIIQAKERTEELETVIRTIEKTKSILKCTKDQKKFLILSNDFFKFISSDKKVYGSTFDEEYVISDRLYELEEMLQSNFIRISNTEIININHITHLELTNSGISVLYFKNGEQTSSSRRYLKLIKERLL